MQLGPRNIERARADKQEAESLGKNIFEYLFEYLGRINPIMDQFDAFFRRADLDQDGKISGAEAVGFFQGSGLPKQVLAQAGRGRGGRGKNEPYVGSVKVDQGKGPVGLVNVLNMTCYFNAVFQLLLSLKVVLEEILSRKAGKVEDDSGAVEFPSSATSHNPRHYLVADMDVLSESMATFDLGRSISRREDQNHTGFLSRQDFYNS